MKEKSILWWIIFILLCIWQLPQLLVALVMLPFLGKIKLIGDRHYNFCFESEEMSGGISLGPLAYVSKYLAMNKAGVAHELDGHTVQSKILGPLYLFVIGIPSIVWAMTSGNKCYYSFYTESWANKCANLEVDEYCDLKFKINNDSK